MSFTVRIPTAPVSDFVAQLWDCDVDPRAPGLERILPSPAASLVINLLEDETRVYRDQDAAGGEPGAPACVRASGSVFGGPASRSILIDTAEQVKVMGVVFRPGGAAPWLRENLAGLADRDTDLDAFPGLQVASLRERLLAATGAGQRLDWLEAWLRRQARGPAADRLVAHALACLDRVPAVAGITTLATDLGLSPRRFGARFREQVGLSPKRYARLRRFQSVVACVHRQATVDWAGVAVDAGFHDQPHLVHEFRAFAGMSPGQYLAWQGQHANHVPLPPA